MANKPLYARPRLTQGSHTPLSGGNPIKANMGVSGIEETKAFLNKIPVDLRYRVLGKALQSAGNILRYAEIGAVEMAMIGRKVEPVQVERTFGRGRRRKTVKVLERGVLAKALRSAKAVITKKNWDKNPIVWVRATKNRYASPYNAWYAHFYEFGTKRYKKRPQGYGYVLRAYNMVYGKCVREINRHVIDYFNKLPK